MTTDTPEYQESLEYVAEKTIEYAQEKELDALDVAYEIEQHIDRMPEEAYYEWDRLVIHVLEEEFERLKVEGSREYRAGDIYVLKDAGETHSIVSQDVYEEVEELME